MTPTSRTLALAALAACALRAQPAPGIDPRPVPDAAAVAAARAAAVDVLADLVLEGGAGGLEEARRRLFAAARATGDDALRYVLLEQAVRLAERQDAVAEVCSGLAFLAQHFRIDHGTELRLRLGRMLHGESPRAATVAIAIAALQQARAAVVGSGERALLQAYDLAVRAAVQGGDPWLHAWCAAELPALRAAQAAWDRRDAAGDLDGPFTMLWQHPHACGSLPLGRLAFAFRALPDALAARTAAEAGPERLLELTATTGHAWCQRPLRIVARELLGERLQAAGDDAERARLARALADVTALLADQDGVTRLAFRKPADLDQLVIANGRWQVEGGLLVGAADGQDNFATHRLPFRSMRSVVIRGGIRSADGLNFRCKAGDVNLLLNWEVRPENHLWYRGTCTAAGPRALAPGQEHVIAMHATAGGTFVFVDDHLWWTAPGGLEGTVTVYPALGSQIFVREVLIDGDIDVSGPVSGPSGGPM